jgi:hypothetical protein
MREWDEQAVAAGAFLILSLLIIINFSKDLQAIIFFFIWVFIPLCAVIFRHIKYSYSLSVDLISKIRKGTTLFSTLFSIVQLPYGCPIIFALGYNPTRHPFTFWEHIYGFGGIILLVIVPIITWKQCSVVYNKVKTVI